LDCSMERITGRRTVQNKSATTNLYWGYKKRLRALGAKMSLLTKEETLAKQKLKV
jgi:hypothetical protein